ncbi:threonine synthase-like protein, partial [Reticulomyxa filosa]
ILGRMMEHCLELESKKTGKVRRANILCETSGDTGPAAVSSVVLNTKHAHIFCLFPQKQVTAMQARQLTTMMPKHKNVSIYATDRNSDDQWMAVKRIFNDRSFVTEYNICAMNSIHWIRICVQMCYYFYSYFQVCPKIDQSVTFVIPSGAFGNTCAAIFARKIGLPIHSIVPSTNENDIVYQTLTLGNFSWPNNYHK